MKYQSSNTKTIYELDFEFSSGKMLLCPECSNGRKKSNKKDLKYYQDTNRAYCHHCNTTFFEYKPYIKKKEYVVPEWRNKTKLTDRAVKWFTSRMISQQTLNLMQIFSDKEWMPQFEKEIEVMCFPFFVDGEQKNIKFRGANKSFKLNSGSELIWYNFDALKDNNEIIICEGEIDLLTWLENGFLNVISVPNGAGGNLEYLDNSIELFENIDKIYLSLDVDSPGIKLRDELIRRLGAEKCNLVNFKQHKDANDYFIGLGGIEFKELLKDSKPIPISGIVKIESFHDEIQDLYENGEQSGLKINSITDNFITWDLGRLLTITGVPGSGKSEFLDYLVCRLNLIHGWKAAFFTPENYPLKYHYRKIHSKLSGKKFYKKTDTTNFYNIYEHINSNYYYILDENDFTVDHVISRAKMLVKQYGVKILVIDPYNKLEHQYDSKVSETQYISKFLDVLTNFARFNNVLVCLVAHPRKMEAGRVPSLYDINGSANFYNKTDYGITIHRNRDDDGAMINQVDVHIQKVKFKHLGTQGLIEMNYNYNNGRFEDTNNTVDVWDNSNWLYPEESPININQGIEPDEDPFKEIDEIPF
ncbi:MAG: bifunctional DNA primase/helicase [Candidatus Hodarchaeales archaeon]|jgi:twinkle protein